MVSGTDLIRRAGPLLIVAAWLRHAIPIITAGIADASSKPRVLELSSARHARVGIGAAVSFGASCVGLVSAMLSLPDVRRIGWAMIVPVALIGLLVSAGVGFMSPFIWAQSGGSPC
jgi:hypothetical protein